MIFEGMIMSLESKVIEGLAEPMTIGELSEKIGVSPSPLLKTLQFMYQKKQVDCQRHMGQGKLFWSRKGAPLVEGAELVTGPRRLPEKPAPEAAPKKVEPKADAVSYTETKLPHGPQTKKCPHGTPPYSFCNDCFRANNNMDGQQDKPKEKPVVADNPNLSIPPPKIDRRSAEWKEGKRKLIRPHQIVSEYSAELDTANNITLYEIYPLPGREEPKIEQSFCIPIDCVDGLIAALQDLKKLYERVKG